MFVGIGESWISNVHPWRLWLGEGEDVGLWEDRLIEAGGIHHGCLIHDPSVAEALEMFCYFLISSGMGRQIMSDMMKRPFCENRCIWNWGVPKAAAEPVRCL